MTHEYRYTHTGTEAGTGYFSCEPHPEPSLPEALERLAAQPYDDFLRRHLLNRLAAQDADALAELFRRAAHGDILPDALAALAAELAFFTPGAAARPAGAEKASASPPATSLVYLRLRDVPDRALHAEWNALFATNQQQHSALPAPDAVPLAPLYEKPAAAPGLPGTAPVFTAPFAASLAAVHAEHKKIAAANGTTDAPGYTRPPSGETAALAEERLAALGILAGGEMRHTASLSPVGLLRPWNIRSRQVHGRHDITLSGVATAYGRGLSLDDARASCLMETVERASVYLSIGPDGVEDRAAGPVPLRHASRSELLREGGAALDPNDFPLEAPYKDQPLVWVAGEDGAGGRVFVPLQMAGLFCNLDEISLFDAPGSTGIAAGCTPEEARLGALLEIIERDAQAVTPYSKSRCFTVHADAAADPLLAALLADYAARRINVQFQDLTGPLGVPVYKCFVMSPKGVVFQGFGCGLNARRALVSALTETPFPYPDGGPSGPLLRKLPVRPVADLPDYSLPTPKAALAMLEDLLTRCGRPPVYVDLTRKGLVFPVARALVPGMEMTADRDACSRVPFRLYENFLRLTR